MIFSLLNIRKKTAAVISGIAIAIACLWGLSMWQNISRQELAEMLLATVIMLGVIVICAILIITTFKLLGRFIKKVLSTRNNEN